MDHRSSDPGDMTSLTPPHAADLPPNFTVEVRVSGQRKVKCYIDTATGRKFYSRTQVSKYMESGKSRESGHNKQITNGSTGGESGSELDVAGRSKIIDGITGVENPSDLDISDVNEISNGSIRENLKLELPMKGRNQNAEWLPSGWIVEEKVRRQGTSSGSKYKCYIDPESGLKFFSKPEVLRYLSSPTSKSTRKKRKNADGLKVNKSTSELDVPQSDIDGSAGEKPPSEFNGSLRNGVLGGSSGDKLPSDLDINRSKEIPEWLPSGWIVEERIGRYGASIGHKSKCYVDPESGKKFFSKPQVLRYVESLSNKPAAPDIAIDDDFEGVKSSSGPVLPQTPRSICKSRGSEHKQADFNSKAKEEGFIDGLPPGWTKETRLREHSSKKTLDPYYIDPVTGYAFRSKPDALRYLETGDTSSCKIKPKKWGINDKELMNGDVSGNGDDSAGMKSSSELKVPPNRNTNVKNGRPRRGRANVDDSAGVKSSSRLKLPVTRKANIENGRPRQEQATEIGSGEWLPTGWVKETKLREHASGKVHDTYYIDPVTGYVFRSKPDVLRFLETGNINSCKIKPRKRGANNELINEAVSTGRPIKRRLRKELINEDIHANGAGVKSSSKLEMPMTCKTMVTNGSPRKVQVTESNSADWLPTGWLKESRLREHASGKTQDIYYIDTSTGYAFRSKPDVQRYLETGNIKSCRAKPKKWSFTDKELINKDASVKEDDFSGVKSPSEPSMSKTFQSDPRSGSPDQELRRYSNKGIVKGSTDWLPPGWTIEIREREYSGKINQDKYYIDPVSGYAFLSKPDVLRYLESGDIRYCRTKPRKWDVINKELEHKYVPPLGALNKQDATVTTARSILPRVQNSRTKNSSKTHGLEAPEAKRSKKMQDNDIKTPDAVIASVIASISTEDDPSEKLVDKLFNEDGENSSVSTPPTDVLGEEVKHEENGMLRRSSRKKKKTSAPQPSRTSQRPKRVKTNFMGDYSQNELGAGVSELPGPDLFEEPNNTNETEESRNEGNQGNKPVEAPVQEVQPVGDNGAEKMGIDELDGLFTVNGATWPDPCLDFAVKTLTGTLSAEDNMVIQELFEPSDYPQACNDVPPESASVPPGFAPK